MTAGKAFVSDAYRGCALNIVAASDFDRSTSGGSALTIG